MDSSTKITKKRKTSFVLIKDSSTSKRDIRSKPKNDKECLEHNRDSHKKIVIQVYDDDDDDDDFVTPLKRAKQSTVEQSVEKRNTVDEPKRKPFVDFVDKKLKARVGVINLKNCVDKLSHKQKLTVKNMGFGAFLSIKIETIPTRMAHWLVSNYDADRNELNVGNHIIGITENKVHDILGIPMGKLSVVEKIKLQMGSSKTLKIWKSQFKGVSRVKVSDVLDVMKLSEEAGFLFKLNWLVIHNTILGWTTKSTTRINWCEYLIKCLRQTKNEWNGKEPFNGPLLFLTVLYVHEKKLRYNLEPQKTPTITSVTNLELVELDTLLYENGLLSEQEEENDDDNVVKENEHVEERVGDCGIEKKMAAEKEQDGSGDLM